MKRLIAVALVLFMSGCASSRQPAEPDWLNGTSERYPQVRYLLGQGQASSAALARDRARADLAKVFEVRIVEEARDSSSATSQSNAGATDQTAESRAERQITVQADHVLEGVQIAEVWPDGKGEYHALAVLDRLKAGDKLRREIADLDALTERAIGKAREGDDLLVRIDAAAKAAQAQRDREQVQRYLRVIDITGVGVPSRYEASRLASDFEQLARRVRISTEAGNDPTGKLATLLSGAVGKAGFSTAPADACDYTLVGDLSLDESRIEGWYWAKGMLEVKLVDHAGTVRNARQWPVKASAQQPGVARQRVAEEVQRLLDARLREAVLSRP